MLTIGIIILAAVALAGFSALFFAAHRAVDGYEDEFGFHVGVEQWPADGLVAAVAIGIEGVAESSRPDSTERVGQPAQGKPVGAF